MVQLSKEQLRAILSWAKSQQSKTAGDLLSRARHALGEWDRVVKEYNPQVRLVPRWFGVVVEHRCGCPAWSEASPCKHVVALLLLMHRDLLSQHSEAWAGFFKALDAFHRSRSLSSSPRPASSSSRPSSRPSGSSRSSRSFAVRLGFLVVAVFLLWFWQFLSGGFCPVVVVACGGVVLCSFPFSSFPS